jgi:hypothetical protein
VLGKYGDDHSWLGDEGWPVAYHGTGECNVKVKNDFNLLKLKKIERLQHLMKKL